MASKEDLFEEQKSFMFAANFAGMHKYGNRIDAWYIYPFLSRPICVAEAMLFSVDPGLLLPMVLCRSRLNCPNR